MEAKRISSIKRELKLRNFQFNSIFEFSSSLYASFKIDNVMRVFFSTIMGQTGVTRIFFFEKENDVFCKRGFTFSPGEKLKIEQPLETMTFSGEYVRVGELDRTHGELKELLGRKKIDYLLPVSDSGGQAVLGLGLRFNSEELRPDDLELAFFLARFALIAIKNAIMVNRLIESQRLEHEIKIARDIQHSLLPQKIPEMKNFELSVVYKPINEVGGDYFDILRGRSGQLPIMIADVEGKGLPAALLAASSQAVFHAVNELFQADPSHFVAKTNSLVYDFTRGNRFITVFFMQIDDARRIVTCVNAGHERPILIRSGAVRYLDKGGFLTGFIPDATYEQEELQLESGDLIVAFTDGVPEVENRKGEEFGRVRLEEFFIKNHHLGAEELTVLLQDEMQTFSGGKKSRDDFTLMVVKAC